MRHTKPNRYGLKPTAVLFTMILSLGGIPTLQGNLEAQSATYASGALVFNPQGGVCATTSPEAGYLTMSPGVKPSDGYSFTFQAVIRSTSPTTLYAMTPLGSSQVNGSQGGLTIFSQDQDTWTLDFAGDSRISFNLPASEVMVADTWYKITVVGDLGGISMWLDGQKLTSTTGATVITATQVRTGSNQVRLMSGVQGASSATYRFSRDLFNYSTQIGAWTPPGYCGQGFDMSNARFTNEALFSLSDLTVEFPQTPLAALSNTTLLINSTRSAFSASSSDDSSRQALTNVGFADPNIIGVKATTDINAPSISVTTPPTQTVQPGQPVTCEISSTGGAITSYSVDPSPGPGMSFSSTSGVLRGAPTSSGSTTYTITGFNNSGSVSSSCTITVSTSSSSNGSGGSVPAGHLPQAKPVATSVYFAPNSAILDKASKKVLRGLVAKLKNSTQLSIRVDGHADSIVGLMPNSKLATARARVVAKYLRARVKNATFFVRAFSSKRPAVLGKSSKAYSLNRRSVISATFSQ